jgi:serine/threonine-protein kinase
MNKYLVKVGFTTTILMITLACALSPSILPTSKPEILPTIETLPTSIPGWEKFEANGVELWLPESYDGGNVKEDLQTVVEKIKSLGPEYQNMATVIEQNPDMFAIWAFDSKIGASGSLTSAAITFEKVMSVITIDTYLDAASSQLPASFVVTDRQIVKLNGYDAGRLMIEFSISGTDGKELMYAVKNGNTFWVVTYGTGADEFDQRLPEFEKSALTFKVND